MRKQLFKLFIAPIFIIIDFYVNQIDLIPDFIGYFLFFHAAFILYKQTSVLSFKHASFYVVGLSALNYLNLFLIESQSFSHLIMIGSSIVIIFLFFEFIDGFKNIPMFKEKINDLESFQKKMLSAYILIIIHGALTYIMPYQVLLITNILIGLMLAVIVVYYLYFINKLFNYTKSFE